ncbi:Ribosomal RNA small subunit methyltransferase I [Buchnera aphidicola (Tetraneura ulmi)]|uniref:16S rRNA (cytidine(1402)-2'-O)-methyltransferase n=1 Tax=Buchnera aphidicola TaxID=9 RepID=UPI003464D4A0
MKTKTKFNLKNIINKSCLYIVPTPIGNLLDITKRSLLILEQVNIIAAENIFHTIILLKNFNIKKKKIISFHKYNEEKKTDYLVKKLLSGETVALVSNAGTPIINDPGFVLVKKCQKKKIRVIPLPGACSIITALVGSGLPANKFSYEGFFPKKKNIKKILKTIKKNNRTTIFLESSHRIINSMKQIVNELGENKKISIAKEITKVWELFYKSTAIKILKFLQKESKNKNGEFIILIKGKKQKKKQTETKRILNILNKELPLKQSILLTSKICQEKKNQIYKEAIKNIKNDKYKKT